MKKILAKAVVLLIKIGRSFVFSIPATAIDFDLANIKCEPVSRFIICILAHAGHGKTSVADSLLAIAGIVNPNFMADTRYLGSRRDKQANDITLKNSIFSLIYQPSDEKYIFTVLDTPGHMDFSKEVSSVVKSCNGAVIVVDVVEGVLAQTRESIKIALNSGLKMILLINKYDRLILNKKRSFYETCFSILRVLENTNDVLVEIFEERLKVRTMDDEIRKKQAIIMAEDHVFAFENYNVIIGSSLDGWGILPRDMLKLFLPKDDEMDPQSKKNLESKVMAHFCNLDYYYSSHHTVRRGAIKRGYDSMLMVMVVKTLYYVYHTLLGNKEIAEVAKIAGRLKIENITSEMYSSSSRTQLRSIMRSFAPLGETIMRAAILLVPEARDVPLLRLYQMIRKTVCHGDGNNLEQFAQMMSDFEFSRRHLNDFQTNKYRSSAKANSQKLATYAYISKPMSVKQSDITAPDSMKKALIGNDPTPAAAAANDHFIPEMDVPNPSSSCGVKRELPVWDVCATTAPLKLPKLVKVMNKICSKTSKGLKFRKCFDSTDVQPKVLVEFIPQYYGLREIMDGRYQLQVPGPELPVFYENFGQFRTTDSDKTVVTPMFADHTVDEDNFMSKNKENVINHCSAYTSTKIEKKNDQSPVKHPTLLGNLNISTQESNTVRKVPKVRILEEIIIRPGQILKVEYEPINQ